MPLHEHPGPVRILSSDTPCDTNVFGNGRSGTAGNLQTRPPGGQQEIEEILHDLLEDSVMRELRNRRVEPCVRFRETCEIRGIDRLGLQCLLK